ncbi:MAG: hypothetical protein LWX11_06400 [Firmicutes bacterium]|nr:hypothetical protein [Bacillota bacterium]
MERRKGWLGLVAVGIAALSCTNVPDAPPRSSDGINVLSADEPNTLEAVANDIVLPHEGRPHGVPSSFSWALNPTISAGNNPGNFTAMIAWGSMYEDANGNPATNTRVQLRDIKAYMLSKGDGQWRLLQSSVGMVGAAYHEDFAGNEAKAADLRHESDGSISVTAGGGYNFHFYPSARATIDPNDIAGIFTTVKARLIVGNPSLPDDRATARYLVNMGGDYWVNQTALWTNDGSTVKGIALARFKYVKTGWRSFNMTTLTEAQLRLNPPPL